MNPIDKIISWAKKEEQIKVLMLTGSLVGNGSRDELSDYDVAVFTTDVKKYANDDSWIHSIEKVWVYEPHFLQKNNKKYPTRLVIYKDGLQVDFAIFDLEHLKNLKKEKTLPVEYNLGYKILLDKENLTKDLQQPDYKYPFAKKPTQEEFDLVVSVFFFEAFKEAKALFRKDLWHAKIRDWSTKKRLLKMIEWNEKVKNGWNYDTNCDGKRMQSWVSQETWKMAHEIFARFDEVDSFEKLKKTIDIFHKISVQIADALGLKYSDNLYKNVSNFIKNLNL